MRSKRNRALSWTLLGLGVAIVGLGLALTLASPYAGRDGSAWAGRGGGRQAFGLEPRGRGWMGTYPFAGRGLMMGRGLGAGNLWLGFLAAAGIVLIAGAFVSRAGRKAPDAAPSEGTAGADAIADIRLAFAEGRLSEADYRSRLAVLHETRRSK